MMCIQQLREWNPEQFFRHMTPEVIGLFSERAKVPLALDDGQPPWIRLYKGWQALDRHSQERLSSHLIRMNDMSYVHARPYLEPVARKAWENGNTHLLEQSRDWSAQDLAMRLYIHNRRDFLNAHRKYSVDTIQHGREYRGRYRTVLECWPAVKRELQEALQEHFSGTALGSRCKVEDHENEDKYAIFVYYEDEVKPYDQFTADGRLEPGWQREVQYMFAVFYSDTSTLRVKAPRKAEAETLRDLFSELYIGDRHYFEDPLQTPRFRFDVLRDLDFAFPTDPSDQIENVGVARVSVLCKGGPIRNLSIDLGPGVSVAALNEALECKGLDRQSTVITGVDMRFRFQGHGCSKSRTISINNRGTTNLDDTPRDSLIRRYLKLWRIDATP